MDKPITELLTPLEITETAEMNIQSEDEVYLFTWNPNDRKATSAEKTIVILKLET